MHTSAYVSIRQQIEIPQNGRGYRNNRASRDRRTCLPVQNTCAQHAHAQKHGCRRKQKKKNVLWRKDNRMTQQKLELESIMCMYVCYYTHTCMYVCMYVCMYIYIYIYTAYLVAVGGAQGPRKGTSRPCSSCVSICTLVPVKQVN